MMDWLGRLPSTNARIALTLVIALATAIRYIASNTWEPSIEWLSWIAVMSGLDAAQFFAKRKTHMESPLAAQDVEDRG